MEECHGVGFTEVVRCDTEDSYKIAQGWTQSTGQCGPFPYPLPTGWKFDDRFADERGGEGSHGGCSDCMMTLVHLITIDPVIVDLCEGIVCYPECYGDDRYSTTCIDGVCIKGILLYTDVPECGYVPPEPITDPKTSWMLIIIAIALAWILGILG